MKKLIIYSSAIPLSLAFHSGSPPSPLPFANRCPSSFLLARVAMAVPNSVIQASYAERTCVDGSQKQWVLDPVDVRTWHLAACIRALLFRSGNQAVGWCVVPTKRNLHVWGIRITE